MLNLIFPSMVIKSNRKDRKDLRKAHQEKLLYSLEYLLWLKNSTAKTAKIYAKNTKKNSYLPFNTLYGLKIQPQSTQVILLFESVKICVICVKI